MLRYGFRLQDDTDPNDYSFDYWNKRYDMLTEEDKIFFHDVLPFLLMAVGLRIVTKSTIPEIILRDRVLSKFVVDENKYDMDTFAEYLERFIGFKANVHSDTWDQFVKRQLFHARCNSTYTTKKQVESLYRTVIEYTDDGAKPITETGWMPNMTVTQADLLKPVTKEIKNTDAAK